MPLVEEDFTWDFIFDTNSAWPMAHILNPFILEILLQKTWLTLILIWGWESIEVIAITIFSGQYVIFVGDDSEIEPVTDTLIGDILQGILGIILARLVILSWNIPYWAPNPIGPYKLIFFKRLIQYIFWVVPLSVTNSKINIKGTYSINIGVFIILITNIFFIWTWYKTNYNNPLERYYLWNNYDANEYNNAHIGILINSSILILGNSINFWYSYFQTWLALLIAIILNIYVITIFDRSKMIYNFFNFCNKKIYTECPVPREALRQDFRDKHI
jgi:hypothetical protein